MSWIAALQTTGRPFIFLAHHSDHTYALKLAAVKRRQPEVVALGGSRINQFRSGMFRPHTFYNAGNSMYGLNDYSEFLQRLPVDKWPRVVLMSIDFYLFNAKWAPIFRFYSHEDVGGPFSVEGALIMKGIARDALAEPAILFRAARDPLYGVPALGLQAARTGTGTRLDGSYQYGAIIRGIEGARVSVESARGRIPKGHAPFLHGDAMDPRLLSELQAVASLCARHGATLVGLSLPYDPEVMADLDQSPRHGIWREFQSPETSARFAAMGILYFNLSRWETFAGDPREMVDPFHPSEPAHIRVLERLLEDRRFRALVPGIDVSALRSQLFGATLLEAYRNDF